MATGAALGLMALATAASAYNQNQTMRHQDEATAAGIRRNMALQQQANQKLSSALQRQAQSNPTAVTQQQNASFLDQLRQNQQEAQQRLLRNGLGTAYAQRAASDAAGEHQYANTLAGLLSQIDAPGLQRQQEQYQFGDLGTQLGQIGSDAAGNQFVTGLKVKGMHPNPWLQGLAQGAGAYGATLAGGH